MGLQISFLNQAKQRLTRRVKSPWSGPLSRTTVIAFTIFAWLRGFLLPFEVFIFRWEFWKQIWLSVPLKYIRYKYGIVKYKRYLLLPST